MLLCCVFFFKQKTAYEMRISDWSSDVCSSDLARRLDTSDSAHFVLVGQIARNAYRAHWQAFIVDDDNAPCRRYDASGRDGSERGDEGWSVGGQFPYLARGKPKEQRASGLAGRDLRSEEHTSELQSLMRI